MIEGKCPSCGAPLMIIWVDSTGGGISKTICTQCKTTGCPFFQVKEEMVSWQINL